MHINEIGNHNVLLSATDKSGERYFMFERAGKYYACFYTSVEDDSPVAACECDTQTKASLAFLKMYLYDNCEQTEGETELFKKITSL